MKVIVSGGWSYGNIGDEAIAKTTMYELQKIWPNAKYVYLAYDQDEFFKHHGIHALKSVHRIMSENPRCSISLNNYEVKFVELINTLFFDYTNLFSDDNVAFVMSGGGYFLDSWEEQFISRIIEIDIAKYMGAKVFIVGQSIGPIYSDKARYLIGNALKQCDYINVRDSSSYNLIKEIDRDIDVKLSCDIVNDIRSCFDYVIPKKNISSNKKLVSLMLSMYSHRVTADNRIRLGKTFAKVFNRITLRKYIYEYRIKKIVKYLYDRKDCDIQFVFSTDWEWDKRFVNSITSGLDRERITFISNATVDELCEAIMQSDYMISSKMHPLIIANSFGIPTIGISYNFKMDDFMKSIGRERYCFINRRINVDDLIQAFNDDVREEEIRNISDVLAKKVEVIFQEMASIYF